MLLRKHSEGHKNCNPGSLHGESSIVSLKGVRNSPGVRDSKCLPRSRSGRGQAEEQAGASARKSPVSRLRRWSLAYEAMGSHWMILSKGIIYLDFLKNILYVFSCLKFNKIRFYNQVLIYIVFMNSNVKLGNIFASV